MIAHYLLTALRHFQRHKLTTAISIIGLAVGLACFILAYSAVSYVRKSDAHQPNAERIVYLTQQMHMTGAESVSPVFTSMPYVVADLLRTDFPELEKIARLTTRRQSASVDGRASSIYATYADPELTDIFGFSFVRGDPGALNRPRSAIITQQLAQRLFGSQNPLGRSLLLEGKTTVQVRAVIESPQQPSIFGEGQTAVVRSEALISMDAHRALVEATLPRDSTDTIFNKWSGHFGYAIYALLGQGHESSLAGLEARFEKFAADHVPKAQPRRTFGLHPIGTRLQRHIEGESDLANLGIDADAMVLTLAGLILLISCLNSASLATAVAMTRAREVGVRRVIGGSPSQAAMQHGVEAMLMALASFLVAVAMLVPAMFIAHTMWGFDLQSTLAGDPMFWLGLGAVLSAVTGVSAAYPAFVLSRVRPADALRRQRNARGFVLGPKLLVAVQFTIASALVATVLAIAKQNAEVRKAGLTSATDQLVVINNDMKAAGVDLRTLLDRLRRQPDIESVTSRHMSPWEGYTATSLAKSPEPGADRLPFFLNIVSHDYLSTAGVRLLAGRDFDRRFGEDESPPAEPGATPLRRIIVDRSTAAALGWADPQDAVGKRIYFPGGRDGGPAWPVDIIGVAEDTMHSLLTISPTSMFYQLQTHRALTPIVRISGTNVPGALAEIETVWKELAPDIALRQRFVDEQFEDMFASFTALTRALMGLAALAVVIAVAGLIGLAVHVLARRTHEIGVRKTLGASVGRITAMLLRDFSRPVIVANLIAWPLAFLAARAYVAGFVRQTEPGPEPYLLGLLITVGVVCIAIIGQSVRAARAAPADTLRYE